MVRPKVSQDGITSLCTKGASEMITQTCLFNAIFAVESIQMLSMKVSHTEQTLVRITAIKGGGEGKGTGENSLTLLFQALVDTQNIGIYS